MDSWQCGSHVHVFLHYNTNKRPLFHFPQFYDLTLDHYMEYLKENIRLVLSSEFPQITGQVSMIRPCFQLNIRVKIFDRFKAVNIRIWCQFLRELGINFIAAILHYCSGIIINSVFCTQNTLFLYF